MAHLFKGISQWDGGLGIIEESAAFCFSGGGHDVPHDIGDVEDGAVVIRWCCVGLVAKVKMTS